MTRPRASIRSVLFRRSVSITAAAGLLGQLGRPLVSLLTLPLMLTHLGKDGLGVWLIALSLTGLIGFVSAGLSASLITAIGRAGAVPGSRETCRLTSAAVAIAMCWGLVVLLVAVPAGIAIDWSWLLGLNEARSGSDVGRLMAALVAMLALGLVATIPRQIMFGRMHGYFAHLLDFAGIVAGALGLVVAIGFDAPLWVLGLVFIGPGIVTQLAGGLIYLHHAGIPFFSRQDLHRDTLRSLGQDSLRMAGYQSAFAVSSQSDLLLIGVVLGAPASAVYGIAHRVFSLPLLVANAVNYAQWPVMARADAGGEVDAIGRMFRRTLVIGSTTSTAVAVAAALAYESLIRIWLGQSIESDPLILTGMVAWVLIATLVNTCDSLLRARQETGFLMRCMMIMAAINVATTLALLPIMGPAGAIWGSVTGYALALLLPYSMRLWPVIVGRSAAASSGADRDAS